jgi:gamma-glutamyl hercynylcysteine S-oxide synthase
MAPQHSDTLPPGGAEVLAEARERTLALVEGVDEEDLNRVHDPLNSPLVWDLGHIAAFEELWLCRNQAGLPALHPELLQVYDACETPRADRGAMPYLRRDDALRFLEGVRERTLEVIDRADPYLVEMVIQHEHQHGETMLQTLQLAEPGTYAPEREKDWNDVITTPPRVAIPAGRFTLGAPGEAFAYDNEWPAHELDLPAYEIDSRPVSNAGFAEFVEDGGYRWREVWDPAGWEWVQRRGLERPLYWTADGEERRFDRLEPLDPNLPVMHVSWYEADAFARWAGRRLPTEAEWERAALGTEKAEANLDQLAFGPKPASAPSKVGALGMLGDAWEWTSSHFEGYPGFRHGPYREYSEVFFGGSYRVLRGGSWATRPRVARATFRNWDFPYRRQIFAGFRLASDVPA